MTFNRFWIELVLNEITSTSIRMGVKGTRTTEKGTARPIESAPEIGTISLFS